MKKIILMAGLLLTSLTQAQSLISVIGNDDQEITEGYVYTSHELGSEGVSKLSIVATNLTEESIRLKLKLESMVNATGNTENVQFCFAENCYFSVSEGNTVPPAPGGVVIAPGASNNRNDHFSNNYAGDVPGQDVVYNLSIIQVDANGGVIGEPLLHFQYKYSPTAGLKDYTALQNMGITVTNTLVKNVLNVQSNNDAKLEILNINGQLIKTVTIKNGAQQADLSSLSAAVYFARFTVGSASSQIKIIKN